MIDTKKTGGAAFPSWDMTFNSKPDLFSAGTSQGMTLRDHFAGLAMQGYLAGYKETGRPRSMDELAEVAYRMADEMLKAREQ
jgi:hypothetical protein